MGARGASRPPRPRRRRAPSRSAPPGRPDASPSTRGWRVGARTEWRPPPPPRAAPKPASRRRTRRPGGRRQRRRARISSAAAGYIESPEARIADERHRDDDDDPRRRSARQRERQPIAVAPGQHHGDRRPRSAPAGSPQFDAAVEHGHERIAAEVAVVVLAAWVARREGLPGGRSTVGHEPQQRLHQHAARRPARVTAGSVRHNQQPVDAQGTATPPAGSARSRRGARAPCPRAAGQMPVDRPQRARDQHRLRGRRGTCNGPSRWVIVPTVSCGQEHAATAAAEPRRGTRPRQARGEPERGRRTRVAHPLAPRRATASVTRPPKQPEHGRERDRKRLPRGAPVGREAQPCGSRPRDPRRSTPTGHSSARTAAASTDSAASPTHAIAAAPAAPASPAPSRRARSRGGPAPQALRAREPTPQSASARTRKPSTAVSFFPSSVSRAR